MSLIYFLLFWRRPEFGHFELGRFVDLAQLDILTAIIFFHNWRVWRRLQKRDKEK